MIIRFRKTPTSGEPVRSSWTAGRSMSEAESIAARETGRFGLLQDSDSSCGGFEPTSPSDVGRAEHWERCFRAVVVEGWFIYAGHTLHIERSLA